MKILLTLPLGKPLRWFYKQTIYKGEYGKEWQRLCREIQYAAVDAEQDLFLCESCGNWKVSVNLSLYAPNDIEFIKNQKYGEMTDEGEKVPYVMKSELEQEYQVADLMMWD